MSDHWAAQYIGVPFLWGGKDPKGWDCYYSTCWILDHHFGIKLPMYDGPPDEEEWQIVQGWGHLLRNERWQRVPQLSAQEGDVVESIFMRRSHCGVMLDSTRMIHAAEELGTMIVDTTRRSWQQRITGYYRHVSRV